MNGYTSQANPRRNWVEFSTTHAKTATVCPTMYCGVPKNLAAFSANRPNASLPNAPCSCARWCSSWVTTSAVRPVGATNRVFLALRPDPPRHLGQSWPDRTLWGIDDPMSLVCPPDWPGIKACAWI